MKASGKRYSPASFPPGNKSRYLLRRILSGYQRQSGRLIEEEKLLFLMEIEPRTVQSMA